MQSGMEWGFCPNMMLLNAMPIVETILERPPLSIAGGHWGVQVSDVSEVSVVQGSGGAAGGGFQ